MQDLLKPEDITEFPEVLSKYFVSALNIRPTDGAILLYIPKDKVSSVDERNFVSSRKIKKLVSELKAKYEHPVDVIYLKSRKAESLESGLSQMLNQRFNGKIDQLYLSFSNKTTVNAWILVSNLSQELKSEIELAFEKLLDVSALVKGAIQWVDPDLDLPSLTAILKATKSYQPSSLEELSTALSQHYDEISNKWLNKQLDKLIKNGFVIREHSEKTYSVTGKGLSAIPNSLNRNSSDIVRALVLSRKTW